MEGVRGFEVRTPDWSLTCCCFAQLYMDSSLLRGRRVQHHHSVLLRRKHVRKGSRFEMLRDCLVSQALVER